MTANLNTPVNTNTWYPPEAVHALFGEADFQLLTTQQSLTAALKRHSRGNLVLHLLEADWHERPHYIADLLPNKRVWQREILFTEDNQPWEWARTWIDASLVKNSFPSLQTLDNRPLGEVLFADGSDWQRTLLQLAKLDKQHPLFQQAATQLQQNDTLLWARRSLFCYQGKPSMVLIEVLNVQLIIR